MQSCSRPTDQGNIFFPVSLFESEELFSRDRFVGRPVPRQPAHGIPLAFRDRVHFMPIIQPVVSLNEKGLLLKEKSERV